MGGLRAASGSCSGVLFAEWPEITLALDPAQDVTAMIASLANVSLLVQDYDEAIQWYTDKLVLELRMDGSMGGDYRFVTVGVIGQGGVHRPAQAHGELPGSPKQCPWPAFPLRRLASAGGGPEKQRGQNYPGGGEEQSWGVQAVFEDLYGNSHVLLEPRPMALGQ